jgi:ATP-dependent DNA helicase DinG
VPEVPAVSGSPIGGDLPGGPVAAARAFFTDGGALSRVVDGYEPRDGQRRMAEAVASVVADGGTLIAEAGTGTGKTLAYLIPAILSGHRVLVSTGTKNLQEQIFYKDLPALQKALGRPFTATLMKGRSNYLCLHRWQIYKDGVDGESSSGARLIEVGDRTFLPIIDAWVRATGTGDRAELRDVPEDLPMWKEIGADADSCLGNQCPRYGDCFVTLMRQRAADSDVVIVNHHLLCADASVRQGAYGEVIPACPTLVVDEAHQLEDVATNYFGIAFSNARVDDLVRDTARVVAAGSAGDAGERPLTPRQSEEVSRALARVADRNRIFFAAIAAAPVFRSGGADRRARYTADALADCFEEGMMLAGALEGLEATLALLNRDGGPGRAGAPGSNEGSRQKIDTTETIATLQRRANELRTDLRILMAADDSDYVYYVENRGRTFVMRASPIDVSRIISTALFERFRTTVLTSATLAIEGGFDYLKQRLGIRAADELCVPSEFDFTTQALLYLPKRMPPPKAPNFVEAAARETLQLLQRSRGRAFVLFTSYAVLRGVQQFLEMSLSYPLLVQGTAPRSALIDQFRSTPNAVLLATASFWQGVDVVGEALSCVIIDKLPFAAPGDPVTAARIEAINAAGGDAFSDYQVPLAILTLQQGLGRLIRHRSDRGVLAVLDPRLRTMGYGRRFLASLPPAPVTSDLDAVGKFFM